MASEVKKKFKEEREDHINRAPVVIQVKSYKKSQENKMSTRSNLLHVIEADHGIGANSYGRLPKCLSIGLHYHRQKAYGNSLTSSCKPTFMLEDKQLQDKVIFWTNVVKR